MIDHQNTHGGKRIRIKTYTNMWILSCIKIAMLVFIAGQAIAADNAYTLSVYPAVTLPAISTYIVIGMDESNENSKNSSIYPINKTSLNNIEYYSDPMQAKPSASFKTGKILDGYASSKNSSSKSEVTCIMVNSNPSHKTLKPLLRFHLYTPNLKSSIQLETRMLVPNLNHDEINDYNYIVKSEFAGTFRLYYNPHRKIYENEIRRINSIKQDLPEDEDFTDCAIPDFAIDINIKLKTIESIYRQIHKRKSDSSRYIPYLQAKLIYDLGIYQTKLEMGDVSKEPLPVIPDQLRIDILRYLESELENNPNPMLQFHYAAFVANDKERSINLLKAAHQKTDDEYLKQLSERAIEILENTKTK